MRGTQEPRQTEARGAVSRRLRCLTPCGWIVDVGEMKFGCVSFFGSVVSAFYSSGLFFIAYDVLSSKSIIRMWWIKRSIIEVFVIL